MENRQEYQSLSDENLIPKIISEDQELFAIIVERYQDKLARYIRYLISEPLAAQDTLQKTFIKAFTHLQSFNTKKSFSSWIYRIAHNEAINHINSRKRFIDLSNLDFDFFANFKSEDRLTEEKFEIEELKDSINSCVTELDLKYKEVLTLFYLENKKYEEISAILKIPTGTVGIRLNRAKEKLKKICIKNEVQYE